MRVLSCLLGALCLLPAAATAQPAPRALTVKAIHTGSETISPAVIVFHKGRIVAMGAPDKVKVPQGALNVPLRQFTVTPGIVDANNSRGLDGRYVESATSLTPGFSAADCFDPFAKGFREALLGGVTHRIFCPDNAGLLTGRAILLSAADQHQGVGLRRHVALFGSIAYSAYATSDYDPSSRSAALRHIRRMFAQAAAGKLRPTGDYRTWRPDGQVLQTVLSGKLPLALRVGSSGDVLAAIALFGQLKVRGILIGPASAMRKVAAQIKRSGSSVVLDPIGPDDNDRVLDVPATLARAGVPFAFSSRAPAQGLESGLLDQAALAVLHGLPAKAAWRALTTGPAEIYGLPTGGKLKVGGEATFLLFNGDPHSFTALLASPVWRGQWDRDGLVRAMRAGGGRRR